jgi:hypothetical membrane protein
VSIDSTASARTERRGSGTPSPPASTRTGSGRLLALGAVLGPILFTVSWLVLEAVSDGYTLWDHTFTDYSPISQSISGLGVGATAPYMNTAFVASGLLLIAGVFGVMSTTSPGRRIPRATTVLLALTGVGQVMCGVFTLRAIMPHMLGFLLAVGTPVVSFLLAGRHFRGVPGCRHFGTGLFVGSPVTLVLLVAYFMAFKPTADGAEHGIAAWSSASASWRSSDGSSRWDGWRSARRPVRR